MAEKESRNTNLEQRQQRVLSRRDPFDTGSGPFAMMRRMQEDMERLFGSMGWGRFAPSSMESFAWSPAVEAFQRGNEFVVRADLPGLSREDVSVEVNDDTLTIRGERKYDHEEEHEGVYRSERSYGTFHRSVPLPEGTIGDSARASFRNGVLEVVMQAPPKEVRRGRRIEIEDAPSRGK